MIHAFLILGSIWITTDRLEGYGQISASGGSASCSNANMICGGGGGGRIAIQLTSGLEWWYGRTEAFGLHGTEKGAAGAFGGAGTVYWYVMHSTGVSTSWIDVHNNRGICIYAF